MADFVRRLAVRASETPEASSDRAAPRTPSLHRDSFWIAADFDAPLPDAFWLGEEGEAA